MSAAEKIETNNVEIDYVENQFDLYRWYDRQSEPQPCFVQFHTETGSLTADFDAEIGNAVPMHVCHRRVLRWSIPLLTADRVNDLLDQLAPLCERIYSGSRTVWDGNNHVGRLDADAEKAREEIEAICDALESDVNVWEAGDFLQCTGRTDADRAREAGITVDTTDDDLCAIAGKTLTDARSNGVDILRRLVPTLEGLRAALRAAADADDE